MKESVRQVRAGSALVNAAEMVDSSRLLEEGDVTAASSRLQRDGYLLLRGYLPAAKVLEVTKNCCNYFAAHQHLFNMCCTCSLPRRHETAC